MAKSRNAQIVRVLDVLRALDRFGGVDIYSLAQRHATSTRTIRRDLDALQEAGVPVVEELGADKRKRRSLRRGGFGPLTDLLDGGHYLALRVAMDQSKARRAAPTLFAALEDLAAKIDRALGKRGRDQLRAIEGAFHSYEKFAYMQAPADRLLPLVRAITERRLCRIGYRAPSSGNRDKTFSILPLRLFAHDGAVYLMASVPKHGSVVTLNLQRMLALKLLEQHAEPPAGFDPTRIEAAAFGVFSGGTSTRYRLQFAPSAAPYIRERTWHAEQRLQELDEGGVTLEFSCSESFEVAAWVASWRTAVTVLEPQSLRDELAALGATLSERYAKAPRRRPRAKRTRA